MNVKLSVAFCIILYDVMTIPSVGCDGSLNRVESQTDASNNRICGVTSRANNNDIYQTDSDQLYLQINSTTKVIKPRHRRNTDPSSPNTITISGGTRQYIELHLVVDSLLYERFLSDDERLKKYIARVVSNTNGLLQSLGLALVLKRLEIWRTTDKTLVTKSHSETLQNFESHRYGLLVRGVDSDVTVLMTNINFDGSTVGFALVDSMCSLNSIATVQSYGKGPTDVAHTLAHEIGHVLGMDHDGSKCYCMQDKCIMAASLSNNLDTKIPWSDCSLNDVKERINGGNFPCLNNIPSVHRRDRLSFCGNGVIDDDEECDCGPEEFCNNPCCDADTCAFKASATCASGPCCDLLTCKPSAPATMCREPISECDLPEYCSGYSEKCPGDTFVENGISCDSEQAHCYNGICGSSRIRCETIFGRGSTKAFDYCFKHNTIGRPGMNCGMYRESVTYKRCDTESVTCGSLYCNPPANQMTTILKLSTWRRGKCFTAFASNITMSPLLELTPDGAVCGDSKMCVNQKCVPIPTTECYPKYCGSKGICNNKGNCHCDRGVNPPTCSIPGYGGSVDSGHSEHFANVKKLDDIFLIIFVGAIPLILLCLAATAASNVWWDKQGRNDKQRNYTATKFMNNLCFCRSNFITRKMNHVGVVISNEHLLPDDFKQNEKVQNKDLIREVRISPVRIVQPHSKAVLQPRSNGSPVVFNKNPKYNQSMSVDSGCISETDLISERRPVRPAPELPKLGSKTPSLALNVTISNMAKNLSRKDNDILINKHNEHLQNSSPRPNFPKASSVTIPYNSASKKFAMVPPGNVSTRSEINPPSKQINKINPLINSSLDKNKGNLRSQPRPFMHQSVLNAKPAPISSQKPPFKVHVKLSKPDIIQEKKKYDSNSSKKAMLPPNKK